MAASLGNATVNVLARTVLFEQSLKRSLKRMSALTAGIFAGVAAANFFGGAIKDAASLELRVARIMTLMEGVDSASQQAFSAARIRDFSNEIGISADKVAESIYYMIGSGVELKDTYDAVRAASNVAVATNTDLKFSADFVSTALNAMGGDVDRLTNTVLDSAHATDIFFAALKEGKGEPRELAQFISTAVPAAKALGISYGEVNAAMAAGTLLGTKARKVTTGLSYIMRGLGNDGKGVGKVFKEVAGQTFPEFVKAGGTLQDAVKKLGTEVGMAKISNIGGAETGLEAIKLLLTVWPQYVAIQKEVAGASGDADEAVDKVNKTLSRQVDILQNKFKNFRGSVGDWLGPVLYDALAKIQEFWPQYQAYWAAISGVIVSAFQAVGSALGPAFEMIKNAIMAIDWGQVIEVVRAVFTGIMAGLTPLFAILGAIVYAFAGMLSAIQPVLSVLNQMKPIIVAVVAGFVAYKAALIAVTIVQKAYIAIQKLQALWISAVTAAQVMQIGATSGLAGAWTALNLIMTANPIGLIIAAIAALTAGFIYAWKNSETFRNVVVAVLNAIIDAAVFAASTMFKSFTWWLKGVLKGVRGAANAWGKLPDILGGGVAKDISGAVNKIINGLDAVQKKIDSMHGKNITIGVQVTLEKFSAANADYGFNARAAELATGTGESIDSQLESVKDQIAGAFSGGGPQADFGGEDYTPSGGGGGANAGKDAAKKAAAALKAALKQVKTDLDRIAKNTSKQTIDQIKSNFDALYEDLKGAGGKKLIKGAEAVEKKLLSLAKKRDALSVKYKGEIKNLEQMRDALEDLKDQYYDLRDSVKAAVNSMGNVTEDTGGIATTFTGIRNNLRKAVIEAKRYGENIRTLMKLGLNQTSLQQLIDAGPEAGAAAARTLAASGAAGIKTINDLQTQLTAEGQTLGTDVAEKFFRQGINIAKGLIRGLESEEAAIVKQMDKIADKLVESIKKKLGIKSPSRVFGEVGENISKGLAGGILSAGGLPGKAANTVAQTIHFGPGSVSVSGAGGMTQRDGILTGQGIVQVLQERQVSAQLAGVI